MIGILYVFIAMCGLLIGSFLNAWMWRLKVGKSVMCGRSMCPHCGTTIQWRDLIPIISFVLLRGQCRHCHKRIDWQYPLVEAWVMFACIGLFAVHGEQITTLFIRDIAVISLLTSVFVYDLRYGEIEDWMTVVPGLIYIPIALVLGVQSWLSIALGVGVGTGFFLLQYAVSKGKWIGGGDIRLGFFMGAVLGWPGILVGLLTAYILGAVVSLILIGAKKATGKSTTPFGTYLSVGTAVALLAGDYIIEWYLGFL
ncbi:MAG: hypothetical protein A3J66_01450 [Candidatus Magasanikbacteria bacterium RIFCSPHIGHO2_02_FULL_47_14]|uniref:Prepilin leader peptidase/N-methyltransferase n=1 Tax=Candidatus Magasanikbacteria bacterium RIFCSPHIGHO2_02_FULL_47_14 TaxID=1798680 RepID=A0A1F6M241_9BACT|nr:MAG: hypothetical protein A3J66_01450 [Candidatus Magasanikbacteria bacterium RIFCSPHIGHO2_02_FULL_47_14]